MRLCIHISKKCSPLQRIISFLFWGIVKIKQQLQKEQRESIKQLKIRIQTDKLQHIKNIKYSFCQKDLVGIGGVEYCSVQKKQESGGWRGMVGPGEWIRKNYSGQRLYLSLRREMFTPPPPKKKNSQKDNNNFFGKSEYCTPYFSSIITLRILEISSRLSLKYHVSLLPHKNKNSLQFSVATRWKLEYSQH